MPNPIILQIGDEKLRLVSKPVEQSMFGTPKLFSLINSMTQTLSSCNDGVALAAPQIGVNLRIFVVSERAFKPAIDGGTLNEHLVYINPELQKTASKKVVLDEGCLSVAGKFGKIKRSSRATVVAYDEHGKKFRRGASGLLAEIFQHEIDHLNGILFVDTAKDIREVTLAERNEQEQSS